LNHKKQTIETPKESSCLSFNKYKRDYGTGL
jgi:hypothetical protein